jgi:hypothetical protein
LPPPPPPSLLPRKGPLLIEKSRRDLEKGGSMQAKWMTTLKALNEGTNSGKVRLTEKGYRGRTERTSVGEWVRCERTGL